MIINKQEDLTDTITNLIIMGPIVIDYNNWSEEVDNSLYEDYFTSDWEFGENGSVTFENFHGISLPIDLSDDAEISFNNCSNLDLYMITNSIRINKISNCKYINLYTNPVDLIQGCSFCNFYRISATFDNCHFCDITGKPVMHDNCTNCLINTHRP